MDNSRPGIEINGDHGSHNDPRIEHWISCESRSKVIFSYDESRDITTILGERGNLDILAEHLKSWGLLY